MAGEGQAGTLFMTSVHEPYRACHCKYLASVPRSRPGATSESKGGRHELWFWQKT